MLSYAGAVDSNLTTTQQPVDPGARNTLEMERKKVVDTLTGNGLVHSNLVRGLPT